MYNRKTPKSQALPKNDYTSFSFHQQELNDWPNVIRVISIDPAIRNLAIRVESRSIISDSEPIRTIVFDKLRIKDSERELENHNDKLYFLVTEFLDQYREIFKTCHLVIVERQLAINNKASRISQHILTYFMLLLRNLPQSAWVIEIDPKVKGKRLGASGHLNERGLKQWSVDECKRLLHKRKDHDGLEILEKHKKKADDLADCVCQIEAFFSLQGWALTKEVLSLKLKKPLKLKVIET